MSSTESLMPATQAQALLEQLPEWGELTTIVIHGGSVFEFKGRFPKGAMAEGYYNLAGGVPGLHGHLNLKLVQRIRFQDKPHRGRESYAFVFENADGEAIFKVFLGRDQHGELLVEQKQRFLAMQARYQSEQHHE